jgi:hypothetical protein
LGAELLSEGASDDCVLVNTISGILCISVAIKADVFLGRSI